MWAKQQPLQKSSTGSIEKSSIGKYTCTFFTNTRTSIGGSTGSIQKQVLEVHVYYFHEY